MVRDSSTDSTGKQRSRAPRQLGLSARGRGGFRANAGRKRTQERRRRGVCHRRGRESFRRGTLHVTLRLVDGVPNLRRIETVRWIQRCLDLATKENFRVIHYSVQGNHLHLLVEADDADALSRGMQGLKVRLARRLNQLLGRRRRPLFAERYHARLLRSPMEAHWALGYVLGNFRKHEAERARRLPDGWVDPFSSAPGFDGWCRPVRVPNLPFPLGRPIQEPRFWLLRSGWRTVGALDPSRIPGSQSDSSQGT